jgi:hypothetical protein
MTGGLEIEFLQNWDQHQVGIDGSMLVSNDS